MSGDRRLERLAIGLTLGLGGAEQTVPGGDVRRVSLQMTPYGVEGEVEFVVQDDSAVGGPHQDEVLSAFRATDLGTLQLTVEARHWDSTTATTLPTIATRGLITERRMVEHMQDRQLEAPSVLYRTYHIAFADPVAVLWSQHYPVDVSTQTTLQAVFDAHKGSQVTLTYDWPVMTAERPLVCLPLAARRGRSFRDFTCWLLDHFEGVMTYDHTAGSYSLTAVRPAGDPARTLPRDDVATMSHRWPELARSTIRVVNTDAVAFGQTPVTDPVAEADVFSDVVLRTAISQDVDDRVELEKARVRQPGVELTIAFARYPTVPVVPGSLIEIGVGGGFAANQLQATEPWRSVDLRVEAVAVDGGPERDYGDDATDFAVHIEATLEAQSEQAPRLPPFAAPIWPLRVEGLTLSELGAEEDVTYQIYEDADTSQSKYKVKLPLFAQQVVTAPFVPHQGAGMFYIPIYKDARVLVALDFDRARITWLLDWRAGAQVPLEGQGQQLLLGKSDKSNTSVMHDYQSDEPVFRILRTNAGDTALVRLSQGSMTLKVQEQTDGQA